MTLAEAHGARVSTARAHVVTLATLATLPYARATASSVQRLHPGWEAEVVLIGSPDRAREASSEVKVSAIEEEIGLGAETMLARHPLGSLVNLLVPHVLQSRRRLGLGPVIHLPAGAWILGALEPLLAGLQSSHVLLVPRLASPLPEDGLEPSNLGLRIAGPLSTDFMAVDRSEVAGRFLDWWIARLEMILGTLDGRSPGQRPEGRVWAQRSLELAPILFGAGLLEDPGCNLSAWNLHEHRVEQTVEGFRVDDRWPLRLIDLSGFSPDRPYQLSDISNRHRLSRLPVLKAICVRYANELIRCGWQTDVLRREVGRPLANGLIFDESMHALFLNASALDEDFGHVFSAAGTEAFMDWLGAPAVSGEQHGINRYLLQRVSAERPDVTAVYPDLDGDDGPGFVAWCHVCGREEMGIPDMLLPEPPPAGSAAEPPAPVEPVQPLADAPDPAARAPSVRVSGYLRHVLGLGSAARGYARALAAADVTISTVSVPLDHLSVSAETAAGYGCDHYEEVAGNGGPDFELICVNADELPRFIDALSHGYSQAPRIGVWGWETNSIPVRWGAAFALLDEIWVYSGFMVDNIGAVAPIPVVALPPPVEAGDPDRAPLRLGVPDGFLFLFMFDYLSTIQRKNPVGLIEAFKLAFAEGDGPRLLIKTINAPLRPLAEEEVLWATEGRADIHVVDASLTGEERDAVTAACDCYVSLHRSEGFGLTLAEAMAIGKPVIGTGYSGNLEFMNEHNSFLVRYALTRVGPDCEIYPADGEWAEPDITHAAELMRQVHDDPDGAARIGARAREDVARTLSERSTGAAMRHRLEQLAAGRVPSVPGRSGMAKLDPGTVGE